MSKSATLVRLLRGLAPLAAGVLLLVPATGVSQEARVVDSAISISSRSGGRAALDLRLADGVEHVVAFEEGVVRLDGRELGRYPLDGELENAWRELLREIAGREGDELTDRLRGWEVTPESTAEGRVAAALQAELDRILEAPATAPMLAETTTVTGPGGSRLSIAPGGVAFDALSRQLERLHASLGELGEVGEGADERLALIVHDDFEVPEGQEVAGNLALMGGRLTLAGAVAGDLLILDGELVLEPTGRIGGNVLQMGGELESLSGRLAGEILAIRPSAPRPPSPAAEAEVAPEAEVRARAVTEVRSRPRRRGLLDRIGHNVGNAVGGTVGVLSLLLGLSVLGALTVYFARPQLEVVADTVRTQFGRSFALGLAGEVLFWPVLLLMVVLVITWLVLPFYLLATALALLLGYLGVAHAAGEMFAQRRYRYEWLERMRRSNSYYYVISGLALLLAPFVLAALLWLFGGLAGFLRGLVEFAACLATWILITAGFGATLLSRAGTRKDEVGFGDWATAPMEESSGPGPSPGEAGKDPGEARNGPGEERETTDA